MYKCGRKFKRKDHLKRHYKIHESEREKYFCESCGKGCSTKHAHRTHWNRTHKNVPFQHPTKKPVTENPNGSSKASFFCEYCGKGFERKGNLKSHMKTHGFLQKQFHCNVCNKVFLYVSNLRVHKKSHAGGS